MDLIDEGLHASGELDLVCFGSAVGFALRCVPAVINEDIAVVARRGRKGSGEERWVGEKGAMGRLGRTCTRRP